MEKQNECNSCSLLKVTKEKIDDLSKDNRTIIM